MAASIRDEPLPTFERTGVLELYGDGPLWLKKLRREIREKGLPTDENFLFLAISLSLTRDPWDLAQQLLLQQPGMKEIFEKATAKKELTHSEFTHLTKTISACFPAKRVPSNLRQQLSEMTPMDQVFDLHQYADERLGAYYQRALRLRNELPLTTSAAAQQLVVHFIEGLSDPVLASLAFQIQDREQGNGGTSTLEEVRAWILQAEEIKRERTRLMAYGKMGIKAHEQNLANMLYKETAEEGGKYAKRFGSGTKFFENLKEKMEDFRARGV
ncbi:hypothetical protein HYFRA_00001943 [Hymenoscyphus fraxineus]|uniref:Uncharacterized protein n=1 Tax=Hymenoscyphus fraxineus TaxID=746836 RepID=A0A9N9KJN1_9HELO|nr:hypothetical protein HYFRA_00001943 [Hymenoscyphus fraxineus]